MQDRGLWEGELIAGQAAPLTSSGDVATRKRIVVDMLMETIRTASSSPRSDRYKTSSDGRKRMCLISFSSDRTVTLIRGFFSSSRSSAIDSSGMNRDATFSAVLD